MRNACVVRSVYRTELDGHVADLTGKVSPERVSSFGYDLVGNLVASTEPNGNLTPSDPDDFVTGYGYDPIYQLTSVVNADMTDGKGEFERVPFGRGCGMDSFQRFDGDVEWEESDPGIIQVRAGEASITLWADRGGFGGDISWYKIAVGPCGDRTTSADVVTYTRDTAFGK